MTVDDLNDQFSLSATLTFAENARGGPVAQIETSAGSATIALKGAHVLSWQPSGATQALYLSPYARLDDERAMRGGVPVCWPWFATHPSDPARPTHGTVRTKLWRVMRTQLETNTAAARITLGSDGTGLNGNPLSVSLTVTVGEDLELTLETTNRGMAPETLPQALHTYFAVSDISNVHIRGLDGHDYLDKLEEFARKPQAGAITFDREIDRIYLGAATPRIIDSGFNRTITIDSRASSRSTVVWNPWIDKSRRLGDMPPDDYRRMVCVETANVSGDAITLAPGATTRLTARYSITSP